MKVLVTFCALWLILNYELVFRIKLTYAKGNKVYDMTKSVDIRNGCVVPFDPFLSVGNSGPLSSCFDLLRIETKSSVLEQNCGANVEPVGLQMFI